MSVNGTTARVGIAAAAIAVLLLVAFLVLVRGSDALVDARSGADPATALNEVPDIPEEVDTRTTWRPDEPDTGREMEPATRDRLGAALTRAWLQLAISHAAGTDVDLATSFSDTALDGVREAVATGDVLALDVHAHGLTLRLYSADGVIVSLTDEVTLTRTVRRDDGTTEALRSVDTYDVVLFLDDGNWRVQHLVRRASEPA